MLCTLLVGALRDGAGQLRMTSLPCLAPERDSVRCITRSTGGSGGLRLPHAAPKTRQSTPAKAQRRKERIMRLSLTLRLCAFAGVMPVLGFGVSRVFTKCND